MMIEERISELHKTAHNLAFACYIRKGFVPSPLPEIMEATTSLKVFLKYSPDQPRVPAGNPDGGEWTSGGGEDDSDDDNINGSGAKNILPKISVPDSSGQPVNQANIFVGGAGDRSANRNVADSTSLNKNVYGDNYYATFDQREEIDKQIAQLPEGQTVNLIGHSYGADTAADVAVDNPGRVNTLVTIDPVSHFPPDFANVRDSVNTWVNVDATDNPDSSIIEGYIQGNLPAGLGGPWGSEPNDFATVPITAPLNHAQFDAMMNTSGSDGRTPVQILNGH